MGWTLPQTTAKFLNNIILQAVPGRVTGVSPKHILACFILTNNVIGSNFYKCPAKFYKNESSIKNLVISPLHQTHIFTPRFNL